MNATTASLGPETESPDTPAGFGPAEQEQGIRVIGDQGATGTAAASGDVPQSQPLVKRVVLKPGQYQCIRFPYEHSLESEKELIRKANEELGW